MSSSHSVFSRATAVAVLAIPLAAGCGKATHRAPDSTGGQSGGGGGAGAEPLASGGAVGSGGAAGTGGAPDDPDSLQPTADCIHPEVVEDCEGDFCRIPPGCFIMGAPPNEFGRALQNSDQVQVTLTRPFLIGRTEVTRAHWVRTGLPRPVVHPDNPIRECLEDDCPQGNATSYQMLAYANRLSEMEG